VDQQLGVIFDMDGVLVDSYDTHLRSWRNSIGQHGLQISEADFGRTFGRTSRQIIQQLWPGRFDDEQVAELDRLKEAEYRRLLETGFPEMEGASELIQALHDAGFRLAVGSSGPLENVELIRRNLRAGRLFSAIVHGGMVQRGKPDPQVFLTAADQLGLPPARCAVVEDAPVGLEAARRAGMLAIALTGTAPRESLHPHAHHITDSLHDLTPELIRNLLRSSPTQ
jgi:beta-phosphoglucomutase